jgi:hypothetical protein
MRPLVFATPLLLLVVSADARESRVLSVEQMIGRVLVVHAHQVSELAPSGHKEGDEPYLDHLMLLLKPSYQRLSYVERREFAFFVLAYTHPDAGYGISLMELIKSDAQRLAKDFAAIPDDTLRSKFCLSEPDALNEVIAVDCALPGGYYKRAWELVNATDKEYLKYVANSRSRPDRAMQPPPKAFARRGGQARAG